MGKGLFLDEYRLPMGVRNTLALEAAARQTHGSWLDRLTVLTWNRRPGLLASLATVLVALLALPIAFRDGGLDPGGEDLATVIAVRLDDGAVRLAWSDGKREAYKISKSNDPRPMARAEIHVVKGNVWTDPNPESSPAVFYRVE